MEDGGRRITLVEEGGPVAFERRDGGWVPAAGATPAGEAPLPYPAPWLLGLADRALDEIGPLRAKAAGSAE